MHDRIEKNWILHTHEMLGYYEVSRTAYGKSLRDSLKDSEDECGYDIHVHGYGIMLKTFRQFFIGEYNLRAIAMKILVSDKLAEEALEVLRKEAEVDYFEPTPEELLEVIEKYDAIIVRSRTKVPADVIEKGKNLKVIGRAGVGVDNIDVKKATEKEIPVVNAPRGSTHSVAELVFGHMLSLARHLAYADRSLREGRWEKKKLKGIELQEKTLGIIGFGRIGQEVWKLAQVFGMKCIAYDPYAPVELIKEKKAEPGTLEDVLKNSDFITIHALLTDETRHMISDAQFEMMKDTAYIINCARGGIIDEGALYTALKEKKIAGAALDVFETEPPGKSRLFEFDNIVFTPHLGASTKEGQIRAGITSAEQVLKVLKGEKPDFIVNKEVLEQKWA